MMMILARYSILFVLCVAVACTTSGSGTPQGGSTPDGGGDGGGGGGGFPSNVNDNSESDNSNDNGDTSLDDSEASYRKITLAGTITTHCLYEETPDPNDGLTAFEYIGDYQMELWFPIGGGPVVQQKNWVALREGGYIPVFYGTADECEYTPYPAAYEEYSFEVIAALTLNDLLLDDEPADELAIHVETLPFDSIMVTVQCPNGIPGDTPDITMYSQFLMYWYMDTIIQPMQLGEVSTGTWTDIPLGSDLYSMDLSQNASYTIESSLE